MDALSRARDYLLDNIGHLTRPGNASFDPSSQHWFVPIIWRSEHGDRIVGDMEIDADGRIISAPSRDVLLTRLDRSAAQVMTTP